MGDFVGDSDFYEPPDRVAEQGYAESTDPGLWRAAKAMVHQSSTSEMFGREEERRTPEEVFEGAQDPDPIRKAIRDSLGLPEMGPVKENMISGEQAQEQFAPLGPDGKAVPLFKGDEQISERAARSIGRAKTLELDRANILARFQNTHSWPTNLAAGAITWMVDPFNAATTLLPGVGEEVILARLAAAGVTGIGARTVARAGAGFTSGAMAGAATIPVQYGLAQAERADYGLREAFLNFAFFAGGGAAMHAGLTGGFREVRAALGGKKVGPGWASSPAHVEATDNADPMTRRVAAQAAIAQTIDGRPVDVAALFDKSISPAEYANRQAQLYATGYAHGIPANDLAATMEAVYGRPKAELANRPLEPELQEPTGPASAPAGAGEPAAGAGPTTPAAGAAPKATREEGMQWLAGQLRPDGKPFKVPQLRELYARPRMVDAMANLKIDAEHDVPFGAGADEHDPSLVHVDRHVPERAEIEGVAFNPREIVARYHELPEHEAMSVDGMSYDPAHKHVAEVAEKAAVEDLARANGKDPERFYRKYSELWSGWLSHIEHENPQNPPPTLYKKPYPRAQAELLNRRAQQQETGLHREIEGRLLEAGHEPEAAERLAGNQVTRYEQKAVREGGSPAEHFAAEGIGGPAWREPPSSAASVLRDILARRNEPVPSVAAIDAEIAQTGKTKFQDIPVVVHTPRGTQIGLDAAGNPKRMPDHFGFVPGTKGADWKEIRAAIGPDPSAKAVFVIDVRHPGNKRFEAHQLMLGYPNRAAAVAAYTAAAPAASIGRITPMTHEAAIEWLTRSSELFGRMKRSIGLAVPEQVIPDALYRDIFERLQKAGAAEGEALNGAALQRAHYDALAALTGKSIPELFRPEEIKPGMAAASRQWMDDLLLYGAEEVRPPGQLAREMPGQLGNDQAAFELMQQDRKALLDWLGRKDSAQITDADYARFAAAVRQFFAEDNAPSARLRGAVKGLARPPDRMDRSAGLNDTMRGVIGRMLATPQEILAQHGHPFEPGKVGGLPYQLIVKPLPVSGAEGINKSAFGLYIVNPTLGFNLNKRLHGVTGEGPKGTRLNEYGQKLYRELEEKRRAGEVLSKTEQEDWEDLRDFEVASRYRGRTNEIGEALGGDPLLKPRPEEGTRIGTFTTAGDAKHVDISSLDIMHPKAIEMLSSGQQPQLMRSIAKALSRHFGDADTIAGFPVKPELKAEGKDWYARFADSIKAKEMAAPELPTRLVLNPNEGLSTGKLAVFDIVVPHDVIKTTNPLGGAGGLLKRADYREYYGEIGIDKTDPKNPKIADLSIEPNASRFLSALMLPSFNKALQRELRGHFPEAESIAGVERRTVDLAAQRKLLATPASAAEEMGLALGRKVAAQLPEEVAGRLGLGPKPGDAMAPMLRGLRQLNMEMEQHAPPFYSAVARVIDSAPSGKGTAEQWMGFIRNRPGVKAEELQWLGLDDWLKEQKGPVTKHAVQDYVRANQIEVKEVEKGGPREMDDADLERQAEAIATDALEAGGLEPGTEAWDNEWQTAYDTAHYEAWQYKRAAGEKPTTTRHGAADRVLPGGENYRELLLTLPELGRRQPMTFEQYAKDFIHNGRIDPAVEATLRDQYQRFAAGRQRVPGEANFTSSHWDEPNVLAHIRFNDRVIDGKKTLFIEEVQSDWGQQARRKGFGPQTGPRGWGDTAGGTEGGVPRAPFVGRTEDWAALSMKRMLRYASENGYDKVAWTKGETQAERYDLSKHIDELIVQKHADGTYDLSATLPGGGHHEIERGVPEAKLPDYIGKDLADTVSKQHVGGDVYNADHLKVGGEGMRGFYDEILPSAVNKLVKKYGAKVKQEALSPAKQNLWGKGEAINVHSVDITRPLRSQALEQGFPLFAHEPTSVSPLWATSPEEAHGLGVPMRRVSFPEKFPKVVVVQPHDSSVRVQQHPEYQAAKHGNYNSALELVRDVLDPRAVDKLKSLIGKSRPVLVPVHGFELSGHNAIPVAYAKVLGRRLGLDVDREIMQANRPERTGANAEHRMRSRPQFDGPVEAGREYLIVDDNATMGGTLAELRSHIEQGGGKVIGATVLTGAENSHILAPQSRTLKALREKLPRLETWWRENHGYGFDALTEGEAKYLSRFNSTEQVRDRLAPRALRDDAHRNGQAARGDAQGGEHDAYLTGLSKLAFELGPEELRRHAPSLKGLEQLELFRRSREAPPHEQGAFLLGKTEHEFDAPPGLSGKIKAYTIDDAAGNRIGSVAAGLEQGRHLIIHGVFFNPAATVDRGLDTLRHVLVELKREYPSARTANLDIGDGRTPGPYIGVPLDNLHPFAFEDIRPELKRELDWWWSNQVNPPERETKLPRNVTAPRAYKERDLGPTEGSFQEFKRKWQAMPSQLVRQMEPIETPLGIKAYEAARARSLYSATIAEVLPELPRLVIKGVGQEIEKFFRQEIVKHAGSVPIHVLKDADFYGRFGNPSSFRGYYSPVSHFIVLPESSLNMPGLLFRWLIMHEATHGATARALSRDPVASAHLQAIIDELITRYGDRTMEELGERSPQISLADYRKDQLPNWEADRGPGPRSKKTLAQEYGLRQPAELLAEAFNNPDLARIVGRLEMSRALSDRLDMAGWKKATLWDGILNIVRKLLKQKPEAHSYLEGIMSVTEPLMRRDVSAWHVRDLNLAEMRELSGLKEVPRGEERPPPARKPWMKEMEAPAPAEPSGRSQANPAWYDYALGGLTLGDRTILRRLFGIKPPLPNWIIRPGDPVWGWLAPPRQAVTMKAALDRLMALPEADRTAVLANGDRVFAEAAEKEAAKETPGKPAGAEKPEPASTAAEEGQNAPAAAVAARIPKMAELDAEIAQYQRQLEGVELSPEDIAELEAAHLDLDQANNMLEAYAQAANCLAQGGM